MKVLFMRHAESVCNEKNILQGQSDCALSQNGIARARALGENYEYTDFDLCFTSPLKRARKTADYVTCGMVKVIEDPRLSERALGELEGAPVNEETLLKLSDEGFTPEGGESLSLLDVRVRSFLDSLKKEHKGKFVLVITHGDVMSSVRRVLSLPKKEYQNLEYFEAEI